MSWNDLQPQDLRNYMQGVPTEFVDLIFRQEELIGKHGPAKVLAGMAVAIAGLMSAAYTEGETYQYLNEVGAGITELSNALWERETKMKAVMGTHNIEFP